MNTQYDYSADAFRRFFSYDPLTGILSLKQQVMRRTDIGSQIGTFDDQGYVRFQFHKKYFKVHRVAWLLTYGYWPNQIDHINGVRSDNRLKNLREASNVENARNRNIDTRNKSGFRGVCWVKRDCRWRAQIKINGRKFALGHYHTPEEASKAYEKAAQDAFGDFYRAIDTNPIHK